MKRSPIRKRRPGPQIRIGKLGRIRVSGKAMQELRKRVFERDQYTCQKCGAGCTWVTGQLAHIVSRGAGGSDTEENTRLLCLMCHMRSHNCDGKPVPRNQPS